MSDLREPLHQPPNPEDLRRVPPANPTCARIRGLLRDFVDGDLTRDLAAEVEEHAHRCRVCAVELSRAEHERLMICRAFASLAHGQPSLSPGFSDRVVQRLMDETDAAAVAAASKPLGERRTSPEPNPAPANPGGWAGLDAGRHTLLVTGLLVLLCASIVLSWSMAADREPDHSARLVVTATHGAFSVEGRTPWSGDGLGDMGWLWVGAGGAARVEWHDVSSLRQPAATLDVRGGGEVRLRNGAPLLISGKVGIVTNRPVEIPMTDGSSLRLGKGEYVIAAEVPGDWLNSPNQASNSPFAAELRVEVEVLSGQEAAIRRTVGTDLVAAGEIGVYQGEAAVGYRPGSGLAASQGTVPERSAPVQGSPLQVSFAGRVVDRYGLPNSGASVGLSFTSDGMRRELRLVSAPDGRFSQTTDSGCDQLFAIVQAEPAGDRLDLGITPPQAMPVIRLQSNVQLASALVLNQAAPLRGTVRDQFDVPRNEVRVLPCIVDELFGSVLPLMSGQALTNEMGAFEIHRLPSRLPPHQHLAVLLLDAGLAPTFVPVPERGRDGPEWWAPLSLVARELHDVQLWSMGVYNAPVEIFEEVPGLPPESALVRRTATTNGQGRVLHFPTGGGRLWWRRGTISSPTLRELVRDMSASTLRFRPASSSVQPHLLQLHDMFRPMVDIPGTDLQLVQSYRHLRLSPSSASTVGGTGNSQTLWVIDSQGHPVADAQVFSLQASGPRGSVDTEFHGFTSPGGVFPLAGVPLGTQLYVLGPDGAAGEVTLGAGLPPMIPVRLVATGRVQLAESLRPVGSEAAGILTLRFKRLGLSTAGMRPVAVRFACAAEGWEVRGLPEGAYHVVIGEDEYEVNVPAGGFVTLQP